MEFLLEQLTRSKSEEETGVAPKGVLQTSIQFEADGTFFAPERFAVLTIIQEEIFDGLLSTVQQVRLPFSFLLKTA